MIVYDKKSIFEGVNFFSSFSLGQTHNDFNDGDDNDDNDSNYDYEDLIKN